VERFFSALDLAAEELGLIGCGLHVRHGPVPVRSTPPVSGLAATSDIAADAPESTPLCGSQVYVATASLAPFARSAVIACVSKNRFVHYLVQTSLSLDTIAGK
jgi:hypothetical protein